MKTRPGWHDGYYLRAPCREPDCFGVQGTGERAYPGTDVSDSDTKLRAFERMRQELRAALDGAHSLYATAVGAGCSRHGFYLWMRDWREVDEVIASVGSLLARARLREEVTVCVWPGGFVDTAAR
jgi:hypothetical protein